MLLPDFGTSRRRCFTQKGEGCCGTALAWRPMAQDRWCWQMLRDALQVQAKPAGREVRQERLMVAVITGEKNQIF